MLATNEVLYRRVLELESVKATDNQNQIDWSKFFDTTSVYKLMYTLQIVEAVMEDSDGSSRIIISTQEEVKKVPPPPPIANSSIPLPPGTIIPIQIPDENK